MPGDVCTLDMGPAFYYMSSLRYAHGSRKWETCSVWCGRSPRLLRCGAGAALQGAAQSFVCLHKLLAAPGFISRGHGPAKAARCPPASQGTGFARLYSKQELRPQVYWAWDATFIYASAAHNKTHPQLAAGTCFYKFNTSQKIRRQDAANQWLSLRFSDEIIMILWTFWFVPSQSLFTHTILKSAYICAICVYLLCWRLWIILYAGLNRLFQSIAWMQHLWHFSCQRNI